MSYTKKIIMASPNNAALRDLVTTLYQLLGNKRYLHDLEVILGWLELNPHDSQTIMYLMRDLKDLTR